MLVPREKTKDEVEREEEEYREFLKREVGENLGELIRVEKDGDGGVLDVKEEEVEEEEEGKGKKKKRKSKEKDGKGKKKEEEDHEFLMKCVSNHAYIHTRRILTT